MSKFKYGDKLRAEFPNGSDLDAEIPYFVANVADQGKRVCVNADREGEISNWYNSYRFIRWVENTLDEDQFIQDESLKIHNQRILDAKVQQAANDLWTVDLALNDSLEKWSLLKEQEKEAYQKYQKVIEAKNDFIFHHRDLKKFKEDVAKQ